MNPEKVVVHYLNGRVVKGYVEDFSSDKPIFELKLRESEQEVEEVPIQNVKGVFFVRSFDGKGEHLEEKDFAQGGDYFGTKTKVICRDGEILIGTTQGYVNVQQGNGFFFFPVDPECNNVKAFLTYPAVKKIAYMP